MSEEVIVCHSLEVFKDHLGKVKGTNKKIVIDFTATWCPPCCMMAPIFADLAKQFPEILFLKVDIDELQIVAAEYRIEAMPTFVFLKDDGEELERIVGADKEVLPKTIAKYVTETSSSA